RFSLVSVYAAVYARSLSSCCQSHFRRRSVRRNLMRRWRLALPLVGLLLLFAGAAHAGQAILWDTLAPNPALAITAQSNAAIPSEAADDFFYLNPVAFRLDEIQVLGLLTDPNATITGVDVEVYQTFPFDSDTTRTPVTTRTNGPADNEFAAFESSRRGE